MLQGLDLVGLKSYPVGKGSKLSFTNADLPQHDVVSVTKGADGNRCSIRCLHSVG